MALRGDGRRGQGGYGGALGRLLLQELLRLAVVQRGAAGLQGHGVRAHAGVKAAPRRLDLFQVVPVKLLVGQEAHALHDADLLLGVASVHTPLDPWQKQKPNKKKKKTLVRKFLQPAQMFFFCGFVLVRNAPFIFLHTLSPVCPHNLIFAIIISNMSCTALQRTTAMRGQKLGWLVLTGTVKVRKDERAAVILIGKSEQQYEWFLDLIDLLSSPWKVKIISCRF